MFRSAMLLLIVGVFSTGCASVGPGTIKRDHFNYSAAIGQTGKEELLRNIVRLRYLDAPVFLRVNRCTDAGRHGQVERPAHDYLYAAFRT